jgi:hypothetical protein
MATLGRGGWACSGCGGATSVGREGRRCPRVSHVPAQAADPEPLRRPEEKVKIKAEFSFGEAYHAQRVYPGHERKGLVRPPRLASRLWLEPGFDVCQGNSRIEYEDRRFERKCRAHGKIALPRP